MLSRLCIAKDIIRLRMISTALTTWYQGYYDLWLGGQYLFRIEEMHAHYGMAVSANTYLSDDIC